MTDTTAVTVSQGSTSHSSTFGWANWETWNASLWVNNDEILYRFVLDLVNSKVTQWADVAEWLSMCYGSTTPDGATWTDADEDEMTGMLADMV